MRERVLKIVSQIMRVPEESLNDDSSPDNTENWDSLNHMNLILALEQEFKVQFSDEQIFELLNVKLILLALKELDVIN